MEVRKRNGNIEQFNIDKIKLTLERVSDELGRPFTGWDLKTITEAIEEQVLNLKKDIINSSNIHKIVVKTLKKLGFAQIAKAYDEFEKKV